MKPSLILALLTLTGTPLFAASPTVSKDPALAETWAANSKAYEGKKIVTSAGSVGDIGLIASNAPYAAVPIVTATTGGHTGAKIIVIMPTGKVKSFVAATTPKKSGDSGFGGKVAYPVFTATYVTVRGEPALILGDVTPAAKANAPSALLNRQHPAASAKSGDEPEERPADPYNPGGAPIR